MCRNEALKAAERAAEMKAAGASRVVALVKEDIGTEVADFRAGYWTEEVLLDADQRFFLALAGGVPHKPFSGLASFLAYLVNPFSAARTKSHISAAKQRGVSGNTTGEGFIAGGVYVVRQDGAASYAFLEEDLGDHAPVDDVIEAVKAAVRGEDFLLAPRELADAHESGERRTWKQWASRSSGPDGYQLGDITLGIAASLARKARRGSTCRS